MPLLSGKDSSSLTHVFSHLCVCVFESTPRLSMRCAVKEKGAANAATT